MATSLEIVSWNLRDGINDPSVQRSILDVEPDIAVFPEAHAEDEELDQATLQRFNNAGYVLYDKPYEDNDDRRDRHSLVVMAKPELVHVAEAARLNGRNAIRLTLGKDIQFLGVHLDDRREERRLGQARTAIHILGHTALVAGDFNAMYPQGAQPRLLRAGGPLANRLPARDPASGEKMSKLHRLGSLSQRLSAMAAGTTMEVFAGAGFADADPSHTPTMKKGPIAAQLDHILYRGDVEAVERTRVEAANNLSDHKRIRATVYLAQ